MPDELNLTLNTFKKNVYTQAVKILLNIKIVKE